MSNLRCEGLKESSPELKRSDCLDRTSFIAHADRLRRGPKPLLFQSASLPIVPQRASCYISRYSVNVRLASFAGARDP